MVCASNVNFIFDVSGYYSADLTGVTFHAVTPARILNSTVFTAGVKQTITMAGLGGLAADAAGVTGNLTASAPAAVGYMTAMPTIPPGIPPVSTLNFPAGDLRSNGMACGLTPGTGTLDLEYSAAGSPTVTVVFDVTGFFQ